MTKSEDDKTPDMFGATKPSDPPEPTGEQLRDEGIARAESHAEKAHRDWKFCVMEFSRVYAREHLRFTSEDIRLATNGAFPAPDARSWGDVPRTLKREGLCEATDNFVPSRNPKAHASPKRVWRSLVFFG